MLQDGPKVVSKGPCPRCGSKDNLVTYTDGHQYCFTPGCGLVTKATHMADSNAEEAPKRPPETAIPFTSEYMASGLKSRGLKLETLQRFGYFVHRKGNRSVQLAPIYNQKGEMVYQKGRDRDKNFWFAPLVENPPSPRMCQLYGQHVWGEKHDKKVVITTGEHDAHSVAQATGFKVPAVSVVGGDGSALEQLKANYRWLDRFEEIILWFDNDESGQSVVAECADLFEPGKVKVVRVDGIKDANELSQKGREGDIYAAIWAATTWAPEGIVNAADCSADMLEPEGELIADYPFPILQERTLGIREQEVVYHVAGTGVGKTSIIVEIQHKLLKAGIKFGVMRFEDTRRKAQLDLMSREVEDRLHLHPRPTEEMLALHSAVFSGGLVELFDPERAEWSFDAIKAYIRYMVKGLGCRVVFIDPLSFIVAGANERDERKALDLVAYEFSRMVKHLRFNLQISHHLNRGDGKAFEEGGEVSLKNLRGSSGPANFSMAVFAYERNQQGERPDLTRIRILKNRFAGWTGVADTLKWDDERGVLEATDEPYPGDNNEADKAPSFGPITGDY